MRALIVYESMYGNTAAVAKAIGEGCAARDVEPTYVRVDDARPELFSDTDVLVVGGPTHVHGLSRELTRKTAIEDGTRTFEEPTLGEGLRGWLDRLPDGEGARAAVFDTRVAAPIMFTGSAAKQIAKRLVARGYRVMDGDSFLVTKDNTLIEGELERARVWGAMLAMAVPKVLVRA
jgi:hypothetical protein